MLNKVFLECIIAQKPTIQTALNGKNFCTLICICKVEQKKLKDDNDVVPLYPDDIIPILDFNEKRIQWEANFLEVGAVVSIEGKVKTPNRKVVIMAERVDLVKSERFRKLEKSIVEEAKERLIKLNNESTDN